MGNPKRLRPVTEKWSDTYVEHVCKRPDLVVLWLAVRAGTHAHIVSADWQSLLIHVDHYRAFLSYLDMIHPYEEATVFVQEDGVEDHEYDVRAFLAGLKSTVRQWEAFQLAHDDEQEMLIRIDR